MIDWSKGYKSSWRVYEVDVDTWADGSRVDGMRDATIVRDITGDAPLIESGGLHVDMPVGAGFSARYLRIAMVAEQDGATERTDVCTLLYEQSGTIAGKSHDDMTLTGRSVFYPSSVARTWLQYGGYAPQGSDAVAEAARMLGATIAAPVSHEGERELAEHVVFDRDETVLASAWRLLRAAGYTMTIDPRGRVTIHPQPADPSLVLDSAHARLLVPGVRRIRDTGGVPNRITVYRGDESATITNADEDSEASSVSRGYWYDASDTSPTPNAGEALDTYAARRLGELSIVTETREYDREWWPGITVGDIVRGSVRSVGLDGDMRVVRQSLSCGAGIVVTEKSERSVTLWQG